MGEAIITSRTGAIGSGSSSNSELKTVIFKESDTFIVPKAKNQQFSVRIFGGGGGGGGDNYRASQGGGGGGWMNNAILTINQGDIVQVTIGKGGVGAIVPNSGSKTNYLRGGNGGTSSFGTYISALGGTSGDGRGGDGGSGGGTYGSGTSINGGIGYQFGGGGGNQLGGSGGKWGGGGGSGPLSNRFNDSLVPRGGCLYENSQNMKEITGYSGLGGNGLKYNSSLSSNYYKTDAENGTNTIGNTEVPESLQGPGITAGSGGGGYGGCGGTIYGGGGGYGANGGNYGGGGGGYGGKGGDWGGGGGSYGPGGTGPDRDTNDTSKVDGIFGGGGAGCGFYKQHCGNGGDGICIIQYYSI